MRYLFFVSNYLLTIQNACRGLFWFNSEKTRTPPSFVIETYDLFFCKKLQLFYFFHFVYYRARFTTITPLGATRKPLTFLEGRLGLTTMKRSFPPTGTHLSPRSASVWRSTTRSILLKSLRAPVPCIHWSLMGNTAGPHWVVTSGSHWLVLRPPCRWTVTGKGSMLLVLIVTILKQESVYLVTMKATAVIVTPELGLVLEENMMTTTHVETKLGTGVIMVTSTSRLWATSWCSDKKTPWKKTCWSFSCITITLYNYIQQADNKDKHIKAVGYILVQWQENTTVENLLNFFFYYDQILCVYIAGDLTVHLYELQFA